MSMTATLTSARSKAGWDGRSPGLLWPPKRYKTSLGPCSGGCGSGCAASEPGGRRRRPLLPCGG
eukprot:3934950-Lingulodinium_polyedra.AAC.1